MAKTFKTFLCMALALCLLAGSTAVAAEKQNLFLFQYDEESTERNEDVSSLAAVGDNLYLLTYKGLYLWQPGMQEAELLTDNVFTEDYNYSEDNAKGKLAVNTLISDGKALYGIFGRTGEMNRLTDDSGAFAVTPMKALDLSFMHYVGEDYTDFGNFISLAVQDGALYAVAYVSAVESDGSQFSGQQIMKIDLETGKVIKHQSTTINTLCAYQPGKLLAIAENEAGSYDQDKGEMRVAQLCTVDTNTLEKTVLCDAQSYSDVGVQYDADKNTAYFASESAVYALDGLTGTPRVTAYLPARTWMGSGQGFALLQSGMYVTASYEGVNVRGLDMPGLEAGALTVYGEYGSNQHRDIVRAHQDMLFTVSTEWLDGIEALTNAMISGESDVDVLKLSAESSPVQRLIAKGYALCLSDYPAIMAVADKMDPALLEPYTVDGKLYAIPVSLSAYNYGYRANVMEELGLTEADLPKSIPELLDFTANFYYDYGEDHPEIMLFDDIGIRSNLLYRYMTFYAAQQMRDTGTVSFDTDMFRGFLKGLEAIDFAEFDPYELMGEKFWDDGEAQDEFYQKQALFSMYYDVSGPTSFGDDSYMKVLPLSMEEGGDPIYPASAEVLMINPRTTRADQAAMYVAEYAGNPQKETAAYTLFPGNNDALVNTSYDADKKNMEEYVANLQKQLDAASEENKANLKSELEYAQKELSTYEKYKFRVTEDMVQKYRTLIAPYVYQVQQSALNDYSAKDGNQFNSLVQQYLDGALDADKLVTEMNNRIRMMQLEDM